MSGIPMGRRCILAVPSVLRVLSAFCLTMFLSACGIHKDATTSRISPDQPCTYERFKDREHVRGAHPRGSAPFTAEELDLLVAVYRDVILRDESESVGLDSMTVTLATDSLDAIRPSVSFLERIQSDHVAVRPRNKDDEYGSHCTLKLEGWMGADSALADLHIWNQGEHSIGTGRDQPVLAVRSGQGWKICYDAVGIEN